MLNTRIYAQYRDKPKAVAWYNIVPSLGGQIADVYEQIRTSYNIDTASSDELDTIGRIVVIDRSYESSVTFNPDTFFGGDTLNTQFGGSDAQFETTGSTVTNEISDAIYRVLIKAKIAKNNSDATLDGVVKALSYITNINPVSVVDNEDMTFSVSFGSELSDIERFVFNTFDILPRPQGVQFLGYTEETAITQFGGQFGFGDTRATFGQYFGA